jgi:hypothetical protein
MEPPLLCLGAATNWGSDAWNDRGPSPPMSRHRCIGTSVHADNIYVAMFGSHRPLNAEKACRGTAFRDRPDRMM